MNVGLRTNMKKLREISSIEFVNRIIDDCSEKDKNYAFFIGAGCSASSGIPASNELVRDRWLPRLFRLENSKPEKKYDQWIKEKYPEIDIENPGSLYGIIMESLFLTPDERQREIEELCSRKKPGFGYTVFSRLVMDHNEKFNIILTTNFDDLIEDSFFIHFGERPLVIGHDSLFTYIRSTRTRPIIIKLHGQYNLAPLNIREETEKLNPDIKEKIIQLIYDRGIIFIGYSGNDPGITTLFGELPQTAIPYPIYWLSRDYPQCSMEQFLIERKAVWVRINDFDALMLLIKDRFKIPHPDQKIWENYFNNYMETFNKLSSSYQNSEETGIVDTALIKATKNAEDTLPEPTRSLMIANRLVNKEPQKAVELFEETIKKFPNNSSVLIQFAETLFHKLNKSDLAEKYYIEALKLEPNDPMYLDSYAGFLADAKNDNTKAEELFQKALSIQPNSEIVLTDYAEFLYQKLNKPTFAEEYFQKAIGINSNYVYAMTCYASFLEENQKDYDKAEKIYKNVLENDSNYSFGLGKYADFLVKIRKEYSKAEFLYKRRIEVDPNNPFGFSGYAMFLDKNRKDYEKANEFYKRALEIDPNNEYILTIYASFVSGETRDNVEAEKFYKKALEINPRYIFGLTDYANFLYQKQRYDEAKKYLKKALEIDPTDEYANVLNKSFFGTKK